MEDFFSVIYKAQSESKSTTAVLANKISAIDLSELFVKESSKFEYKETVHGKGRSTLGRDYDEEFLKKWCSYEILTCGFASLESESAEKMKGKSAESIWYDFSHMILVIKMKSGEMYGIRSIDFSKCLNQVVSILT